VEQGEFAARLAAADRVEQGALLRAYGELANVDLARALLALYQSTHAGDPSRAARAAEALLQLQLLTEEPEVGALAAWTTGMAAVHLDGQMERGVALLAEAGQQFTRLGRALDAASTQIAQLQGLAMLGRYDEAIACGESARDSFVVHGDLLAAGKIEQNLGNIAYRRGRFLEAQRLYESARTHYVAVDNQQQLAQIDNNLGTALMEQQRFDAALDSFERALERATRIGLEVTQTEVRYNLGCLALFQGRYDRALDQFEAARRAYARLGMAHRAARIELDVADALLELNMAEDAAAIADRVSATFIDLGMRAEQARALGCQGRALGLLGQLDAARSLVAQARELYAHEGNAVDAAFMTLVEAQLLYGEAEFAAAAQAAARAEGPFAAAGVWSRRLLARWLHAESLRCAGVAEAGALLEATLDQAEQRALPQIAYRCWTSLGQLAQTRGDMAAAERAYRASVALIEDLRAPLPAEEFRVAFLSDKLTPYTELVRLELDSASPDSAARALQHVERARSRALIDQLAGIVKGQPKARDADEAELLAQLAQVRGELTWYYGQINGPRRNEPHTDQPMEALHEAVRQREAQVVALRRRIVQRGGTVPGQVEPFDVPRLQLALGSDAALIEFFSLDGNLLAFVVDQDGVSVVQGLARESDVEAMVSRLRLQIDTVRYGGEHVLQHTEQLVARAQHYLAALFDALLRPLEALLSGRQRLVVVPHRALHYVPFHALYDGHGYVVERRAVSYAPSAAVLLHCLNRPRRPFERALLVGVADEQMPKVHDEVATIAQMFHEPVVLLDDAASLSALRAEAPRADVLHLACHGQFRPDNPLFSSVRLGDGWLTVRDAYKLQLECGLVVLSACETGVSEVAPGEELIGLARGFFSAGTPSLLVSLWTADDASAAELMAQFYARLKAGHGPADALRQAQADLIRDRPHPYHWAAFAVMGRW
jgi:CHAT domain-containing protein/tetratricopeptide (TPR) repeat protein